MRKIYFLCTGNSCRSQIAEGYGKAILPTDEFEIKSAGIEQHGLNPRAVQVMAEEGIDISTQTSDLIDMDYFNQADLIIKDKCPVIPKGIKHVHWDLEDPAKATGTEEEIINKFREIRDDIKSRVANLLD